MGRLVTNHAVIAPAQASQRQAVCSGAREDEVDITIGLKRFADQFSGMMRPPIIPVACRIGIRVSRCEPRPMLLGKCGCDCRW